MLRAHAGPRHRQWIERQLDPLRSVGRFARHRRRRHQPDPRDEAAARDWSRAHRLAHARHRRHASPRRSHHPRRAARPRALGAGLPSRRHRIAPRAAGARRGAGVRAGRHVRGGPVRHRSAEQSARRTSGGVAHQADGVAFGVCTDLGHVPQDLAELLSRCDAALVESNHCADMLSNGPYPDRLKRRVLGHLGHLANDQTAELAASLYKTHASSACGSAISRARTTPPRRPSTPSAPAPEASTSTSCLTGSRAL